MHRRLLVAPRWAKVLRELAQYRTRSLLVVFSVAMSVWAIGVIAGAQHLLDQQYTGAILAARPSHAKLGVSPFDKTLIASIGRMSEIQEATARFSLAVRVQGPTGAWTELVVFALPRDIEPSINLIVPQQGEWPPTENALVLERASLPFLDTHLGDVVQLELPDGRRRELPITGIAHDINLPAPRLIGSAYGYVSFETLKRWGLPVQFNELLITVAGDQNDKEHIQGVADAVKQKIEQSGKQVSWTQVPNPGESPVQNVLDSLLLILAFLSVFAVLLSAFLIVNTFAALLAQQVRQVGVMKAVGAQTYQIAGVYLGNALIYGLLSLVIALPLGAWGAYQLGKLAAGLLNFDVTFTGIAPQVLAIQVAVGMLLPLAASVVPIVRGTRVTVREAISTYGLETGHFGSDIIDRILMKTQQKVPLVTRPLLLSLRNTFRRKGRLASTLIALTFGGAVFIAVLSVRLSLFDTLAQVQRYDDFDNYIQFGREYHAKEIQSIASQVPGVTAVETWGRAAPVIVRADTGESDRIRVEAPPSDTVMIRPKVVTGRWLHPEDEVGVVVNSSLVEEEPQIQVGDELLLKIGERTTPWTVVGIVESILVEPTAYVNYSSLTRLTNSVGRADFARLNIEPDDPASQQKVAKALEASFSAAGYAVDKVGTAVEYLEVAEFQFNILIALLLIMALLMAAVGGMGLMGTMTINVLDRTREIGVLRAIGASDGALLQIILAEGIVIGLLSWLLGSILAWPIGMLMSAQIGLVFVDTPLVYGYSLTGVLLWLGLVIVISALASFLPARNAAALPVHKILSYE